MSMNFRGLLLGGILLWIVGGITLADATADAPPADRHPVPERIAAEQTAGESPSETELSGQQRRRIVTVAFYLLGGVLFVGLMLIALTVLWGIRTRRVARKPLPTQSPGDPLWYLRPEKQAGVSDAAAPEGTAETGSEQDTDEAN